MMITPRQNCSCEKVVTQEAVKSFGPSSVLLTRSAPRHKPENAAPRSKDADYYGVRSHDAVIRVFDGAGNVIETHEHKGDFKER